MPVVVSSAAQPVEIIPGHRESHSGVERKPFALPRNPQRFLLAPWRRPVPAEMAPFLTGPNNAESTSVGSHFCCARTVSKPHLLGCRELLFEREQLPQVVDNRHFRIELIECLEPEIILRNQQVASSILAGGSIVSITSRRFGHGFDATVVTNVV